MSSEADYGPYGSDLVLGSDEAKAFLRSKMKCPNRPVWTAVTPRGSGRPPLRERINALALEAAGHCMICERPFKSPRTIHLDHDHETNLNRGLLCVACNTSLGGLGDNIAGIERALRYLQRPAGEQH